MIKWDCKSCRKETEHKKEVRDESVYDNFVLLICQECGIKEMVPEKILSNHEIKNNKFETKEQKVGPDGGFDRDVGGDCDSGLCPVR